MAISDSYNVAVTPILDNPYLLRWHGRATQTGNLTGGGVTAEFNLPTLGIIGEPYLFKFQWYSAWRYDNVDDAIIVQLFSWEYTCNGNFLEWDTLWAIDSSIHSAENLGRGWDKEPPPDYWFKPSLIVDNPRILVQWGINTNTVGYETVVGGYIIKEKYFKPSIVIK